MSDFQFPGESHGFWEFLCVDKGEVTVTAQDMRYVLRRGQMIFHQPYEFHTVEANGVIAPNLVVISFCCDSPAMDFFKNGIVSITEAEKSLLASVITEARQAFSSRLDDPYLKELKRRPNQCLSLIHISIKSASPLSATWAFSWIYSSIVDNSL